MRYKLRATDAIMATVLVTAATLISPAAAAAPATIQNTGLSPAAAKAAKKPLRAERRTDIDAVACGTSIEHSGGSDASVVVTHYNCSDTAVRLALTAGTSDGTVTLTSECQEFLPGEAWYWEVSPNLSGRRPTFIYRVTECA